jgi:hypothetical protein
MLDRCGLAAKVATRWTKASEDDCVGYNGAAIQTLSLVDRKDRIRARL